MAKMTDTAAEAAIGAATRELHLPTVRTECVRLAEVAERSHATYLGYLAEMLSAEVDDRSERRRLRRVHEAKFPRTKRLGDFDLSAAPSINAATIAMLASGSYLETGDPVVFLGDSGTGKSHLLIGLGMAACEQGKAVRYVTCAALVNELVEAADERRPVEVETDRRRGQGQARGRDPPKRERDQRKIDPRLRGRDEVRARGVV